MNWVQLFHFFHEVNLALVFMAFIFGILNSGISGVLFILAGLSGITMLYIRWYESEEEFEDKDVVPEVVE